MKDIHMHNLKNLIIDYEIDYTEESIEQIFYSKQFYIFMIFLKNEIIKNKKIEEEIKMYDLKRLNEIIEYKKYL